MNERPSDPLQALTIRVSLIWLCTANAVGVLLAAMLVYPGINDWLAPLTYGRWMPLHMDWHLYGWSAVPLLGVLATLYLDRNDRAAARLSLVLGLWSSGLAVLGISWLLGASSGKPFLNGTGGYNLFFALCLAGCWMVCVWGWREQSASAWRRGRGVWMAKTLALLALGAVPWVLYLLADPAIYPPVNPRSGGATGHSLLASTLGIVALMGILPGWGLRLGKIGTSNRAAVWFWGAFAGSVAVYSLIGHGDASNQDWDQILGLGSLCVWPWLVWRHWSAYEWSPESNGWRKAFLFWWIVLAANGFVQFLPGVLEVAKFTNALVAHTHAAMAGLVTALNMVILIEMGGSSKLRWALNCRGAFWAWNGATFSMVVALLVQGWREGMDPSALFQGDAGTALVYAIRLTTGLAMTAASAWWLAMAFRGKAYR